MLHKTLYLIGHINPDVKETYEWRKEVIELLSDMEGLTVINPCDSGFDTKLLADEEADDPARLAAYRKKGVNLLVPKSLTCVKRSDIAIANLNKYGSEAPSLGTMAELSWYYTMPEKSVIGIYSEGPIKQDAWTGHPFVTEAVDVWTRSVREAVNTLLTFFV